MTKKAELVKNDVFNNNIMMDLIANGKKGG
jgi:hypothetical protein